MVSKTTKKKGGKKKFFEVSLLPLTSAKVQLYGFGPEDFEGNVIKLDMTRNLRGKNLELKARVQNNDGKLTGNTYSLQLIPSYLRRAVRKGTDYVEDSFESECKDAKLRIKPLLITRNKVSRNIRKALRDEAKKHIQGKTPRLTKDEIFSEIMSNRLQKEMSNKLKKIYPLAMSEIRMIIASDKPIQKEKSE